MAKEMRMVTAKHRQCCAMPGCGNRVYTYFTRRDNPAGAVWMCADCIKAMAEAVAPVPKAEESAESTETAETVEEAVAPAPKARAKKGK